MANIDVHAGDFLKGQSSYNWGTFALRTQKHSFVGEQIPAKSLRSVQLASEESVKKMAGAVGWGAVGALALGPIGLLAGVLAGGNKKKVTFIAEFKDGRKLLASTDSKTFTQIQAACF